MSFFEKDYECETFSAGEEEELGLPLPYAASKFEDATPADKPAVLWTLVIIALLSIGNWVLYPATVSRSPLYYQDDNLPIVQSSPGMGQLNVGVTKYVFAEATRIARVDAKAESALFTDNRMVTISAQDNALMTFTVPEGASNTCEFIFSRPPITVTSSLTGALKSVEVWELPSDSLQADVDLVEFSNDAATLVTTLDLTKQAALVQGQQEFACNSGEKRMFELRCADCGVQYQATSGTRIGFQLRRQA